MRIKEEDIIFVTDTIFTKWINYQKLIVNHFFPSSRHVIIDGTKNWPNCWFDWIEIVKRSGRKWYIHIEEDCFIEDRQSIIEAIEKMENEKIAIMGVADGYQPYRGGNPLAMTPFFMLGRIEDLADVEIGAKKPNFSMNPDGTWRNSIGLEYKEEYSIGFQYPYEKMGNDGKLAKGDIEPFYALFWELHEKKKKIHYLYPNFSEDLKSINPSLNKGGKQMAVHMFYTRMWNSPMDVHGIPNFERYERLEKYLLEKHSFLSVK